MAKSTITAHYDIDKAVEHLYDVTILEKTILTTVTKHSAAVSNWINGVYSQEIVNRYIGFEVEIFDGDGLEDQIGTLQFCVGPLCLVIQLLRIDDFPPSLNQFMSDPKHTFVAVDAEPKIAMLTDQCPLIEGPIAYRDLGDEAALFFHRPILNVADMNELFKAAFDIGIEMPHPETDWGRRDRLSEAQVKHACLEAFASFELGRRMLTTGNN